MRQRAVLSASQGARRRDDHAVQRAALSCSVSTPRVVCDSAGGSYRLHTNSLVIGRVAESTHNAGAAEPLHTHDSVKLL